MKDQRRHREIFFGGGLSGTGRQSDNGGPGQRDLPLVRRGKVYIYATLVPRQYRGFAISMPSDLPLSFVAQEVRRHDRDRFVTALFAPAQAREGLMVLYAFNSELARVRENVHEAMAGMIRLQWWRDVLGGARADEAARHPVAGPLLALMREHGLPLALFEDMLEARERDLLAMPFATGAEFTAYAQSTAGNLAELAVLSLGARDDTSRAAARLVGQAWAVTGLLRSLPVHMAQGWVTVPADLLAGAGSSHEQLMAGHTPPAALAGIVAALARQSRLTLGEARRQKPPRRAVPVLLQATVASVHLRTLERAGWNTFDSAVLRPRPMPLRLAANALLGRF
jgi:phytoene synthase